MATTTLNVTTVKPLADRVFIKVSAKEERTAGGIFLPETAKEKPQVGEMTKAIAKPSKSRLAIKFCTPNMLALTSNSAQMSMCC